MTELVVIGKVLKPRGLKGELKCAISISLTAPSVQINDKTYLIKKITSHGDFSFIMLDGILTMEQAEKLKGALIMLPRNQIDLADDEILNEDLIGFKIVSLAGKNLGKVTSVQEHGSIIINAINPNGAEFSFPYEDEFVTETNMKTKQLTVHDKMLEVEIAD